MAWILSIHSLQGDRRAYRQVTASHRLWFTDALVASFDNDRNTCTWCVGFGFEFAERIQTVQTCCACRGEGASGGHSLQICALGKLLFHTVLQLLAC